MFTRVRSTPNDQSTERTLIEQLLAGDEMAFTCLVNTHHAALLRFARLFVSDVAAAEDVVQDTWLAVLNGLGAFEGRSTLKTWIYGILANKAKTRAVRDKRTLPFAALSSSELAEAPVDGDRFDSTGSWATPPAQWEMDTPERLVLDKEARAVIDAAIANLPVVQRAVLTMRDVHDLDTETICNILAVTETNQRVLLHRARTRVRAALDRYLLEGTRADL